MTESTVSESITKLFNNPEMGFIYHKRESLENEIERYLFVADSERTKREI